jgi:hypothetical protein
MSNILHNRIKLAVIIVCTMLVGVLVFAAISAINPQPTSAQANLACDGLSPTTAGGNCNTSPATEPKVGSVLANVLNIISVVAGIIAVVMIIISGVKFITSQGDAGKVASARSTVIYAVIGLVIVVISQALVFFIVDRV